MFSLDFRANRGSSTKPRPAAVNMAMLGDTASQPTGTDGTIQSTGAGNIIQPTGAGNTDDMFTDDGKSLDNTGHPPVQGKRHLLVKLYNHLTILHQANETYYCTAKNKLYCVYD